jgi:hypothetical protein
MSTKVKYPRTRHLPWSPSRDADDLEVSEEVFFGKDIVVTVKMDGENTTIYSDGVHARSLDSQMHPSRAWVRALQGQIGHLIEEDHRICGENLFARHSIAYTDLPSYFLMFSAWNGQMCLPWEQTCEIAAQLGLVTVPVLFEGVYSRSVLDGLDLKGQEGYVVRLAGEFHYDDFGVSVAKYVRPNHVQTNKHWMHQEIVRNVLTEAPNLC